LQNSGVGDLLLGSIGSTTANFRLSFASGCTDFLALFRLLTSELIVDELLLIALIN